MIKNIIRIPLTSSSTQLSYDPKTKGMRFQELARRRANLKAEERLTSIETRLDWKCVPIVDEIFFQEQSDGNCGSSNLAGKSVRQAVGFLVIKDDSISERPG